MTIIEGLNELKAQGITKLVGMAGESDIDVYLDHAQANHENALKWGNPEHDDYVGSWEYCLDHEDDSFMVATADGHHIIATRYNGFDMADYSDYSTEEEMNAAFNAWEIAKQASEIADENAEQGSTLPREAWVLVATMELKAAYKAADKAFKREFETEEAAQC